MTLREQRWAAGTPCWVDQLAPDQATTSEFYRRLFGWEINDSGPQFGNYGLAVRHGRAVAGLGRRVPDTGEAAAWVTYLATEDLEASVALVAEHGGQILAPVLDVGGAGRMAVARDPTGAVFGFWEADDLIGFQVANETGTVVWNELMSTDIDRARAFYTAVAGHRYTADPQSEGYATIDGDGPGNCSGGSGQLMPVDGAAPPISHWLTYFAVRDADTAAAVALAAGGTCLTPAHDAPAGRTAVLADPAGASFAVIALPGEAQLG
jgi:predicted enzyme related to lactoylglutathione lyase